MWSLSGELNSMPWNGEYKAFFTQMIHQKYFSGPVRGIEQHAMERGVQGIFYTDDSSEMFLRGVVSILNKELWYPRKILSDQIRNGNGAYSGKHLTFREKDVLLRIVSRNSNHEIAAVFRPQGGH